MTPAGSAVDALAGRCGVRCGCWSAGCRCAVLDLGAGRQRAPVTFVTLLNGLTLAALYFIVASGFTLVFGLMRNVNLAHGSLYLLGGYVGFRHRRADRLVDAGAGRGLRSPPRSSVC